MRNLAVVRVINRYAAAYDAQEVAERYRTLVHDEDTEESRLPSVLGTFPPGMRKKVPYSGGTHVTIYRTVPEGVTSIQPGDWVALSRSYAQSMSRGRVLSVRVPARDVVWAGTDENEWFYVPENP